MPPYGYVIATTTAYRYSLEKSDLVKTANNKRQRLGQLSSHYRQSKISRYNALSLWTLQVESYWPTKMLKVCINTIDIMMSMINTKYFMMKKEL